MRRRRSAWHGTSCIRAPGARTIRPAAKDLRQAATLLAVLVERDKFGLKGGAQRGARCSLSTATSTPEFARPPSAGTGRGGARPASMNCPNARCAPAAPRSHWGCSPAADSAAPANRSLSGAGGSYRHFRIDPSRRVRRSRLLRSRAWPTRLGDRSAASGLLLVVAQTNGAWLRRLRRLAASRLPHQRWVAFAQRFECPLRHLRGHTARHPFAVEAQRLAVVRAKARPFSSRRQSTACSSGRSARYSDSICASSACCRSCAA